MKRTDERLHPANRVHRRPVWVTSGADGTEHAVTAEQMTAGLVSQAGVYLARCGERCVAASMVMPPVRRCTDCLLQLRPGRHRAEPPRGGPLLRLLNWLLGVPETPVVVSSPHPEGGDVSAKRPDGSHGGVGNNTLLLPGLAVAHHKQPKTSS